MQRVTPFLDAVQVFGPRLDGVGEPEREVAERDHQRRPRALVGFALESRKDKLEVVFAELRVEHHEAREGGQRGTAQEFGSLRHRWVRAELHHEWRVDGDETSRGALLGRQQFALSLFTRGIQE